MSRLPSNFFSFSGRATRTQLVVQYLLTIIGAVLISWLVMGAAFFLGQHSYLPFLLMFCIIVAALWSMLTLGVRRLHDMERSGLLILLPAIYTAVIGSFFASKAFFAMGGGVGAPLNPLAIVNSVGPMILLMMPSQFFSAWMLLWPGTKGPNEYGEDPRNRPAKEEKLSSIFINEFFSFQGRISRGFFIRAVGGLFITIGLWQNNMPFLFGVSGEADRQAAMVYSMIFASAPLVTVAIAILTGWVILMIGISMLSLVARRFHDMGQSGWLAVTFPLMMACFFIPKTAEYFFYIWWMYVIFLTWRPGTMGDNSYGQQSSPLRFKVIESKEPTVEQQPTKEDEKEKLPPPGSFM